MSKLRIFKFRKFKSDFPRGKRVKNLLMEKPSPPLRNLVIFSKKMVSKNNDFSQKHEKYLKSKNDSKKHLEASNQELWANFKFDNSEI